MARDDPAHALMVTLASPWGPVQVAASESGICGAELRGSPAAFARAVGRRIGSPVTGEPLDAPAKARALLASARVELLRAFAGEPSAVAAVVLDWRGIPAWDRRVLEGARLIKHGQATSYGRLARRIGAPGAARAVGSAMGRNPFWIFVPCHRVVAGDGTIGGYGGGDDALEIKRDLLALEGTVPPISGLLD
ncbi:MAG: methylated-DNA--[protein]-cysteine S-methyltransferase [Candidatus Limnocylindrales bacterium]